MKAETRADEKISPFRQRFADARMWLMPGLAAGLIVCMPRWATAQEAVADGGRSRASYVVFWDVSRAADAAPFLSVSAVAAEGRASTARTNSKEPEDDRPAVPALTATVRRMKERPGTLELKVLALVREVTRNKKGKRKVLKRNIGALLPMRLGEKQLASSPSDAIRLEVRIERR